MLQAPPYPQSGARSPCPRPIRLATTALLAVLLAPGLSRAGNAGARPTRRRSRTRPRRRRAVKARPEERAAADRLEPLARAAFWGREAQLDPADAEAGVKLSAALRALGQYDAASPVGGPRARSGPEEFRRANGDRSRLRRGRPGVLRRSTRYNARKPWRRRTGGPCRCSGSPTRRSGVRRTPRSRGGPRSRCRRTIPRCSPTWRWRWRPMAMRPAPRPLLRRAAAQPTAEPDRAAGPDPGAGPGGQARRGGNAAASATCRRIRRTRTSPTCRPPTPGAARPTRRRRRQPRTWAS